MSDLNEMQNLNYEQKKNNGKGVFYGVIAVATLIVAIIGATFAYFTAQAQSNENVLSATAATVSINYTEGRAIQATNLVPAAANIVAQAYANPTAAEYNAAHNLTCTGAENDPTGCKKEGDVGTKCVDDNGYFVCAWYEFSVTNESNIPQAIKAYMTINTNDFKTLDTESIVGLGATTDANNNYYFPDDAENPRAVYDSTAGNTNNNLALKFMTIRSADTVDVDAVVCSTQHSTSDQLVMTTDFCASNGDSDKPFEPYDSVNQTGLTGLTAAETASDYTHLLYTDTATGRKYYAYNTTAVRQSMKQQGETQTIFNQEIIPTAPVDASGAVRHDCDANGAAGPGNLTCGTTRTFYVLVWLEENRFVGTYNVDNAEYEAQDYDQGKSYAATITVQATGTGDDATGGYVTGTMRQQQQQQQSEPENP